MPGTDFFDDDLIRQRDAPKRIRMGPGDEEPAPAAPAGDGAARPVSDLNLTRMTRHRQEVVDQTAVAVQELERLRQRQEEIESEKRHLEDLRKKHDDYDRGKRDLLENLRRSLVVLERQEVEAGRMMEVLGVTRKRFKDLLAEIESIKEEAWPEDRVREELGRHLGIIEEARMEFSKSVAKIDALKGDAVPGAAGRAAVLFEEHSGHEERHFGDWLKIGVAVSLPIVITLVILGVVIAVVVTNTSY
jgi:hypothetical protein